jgi:hypothetical protein
MVVILIKQLNPVCSMKRDWHADPQLQILILELFCDGKRWCPPPRIHIQIQSIFAHTHTQPFSPAPLFLNPRVFSKLEARSRETGLSPSPLHSLSFCFPWNFLEMWRREVERLSSISLRPSLLSFSLSLSVFRFFLFFF